MEIFINQTCENTFYLLAMLNPASKIMFLASYEPALTRAQNRELSWKSSLAALTILIILALVGSFVLGTIFRVELYSMQITGGLVVFLIGLTAIQEGKFTKRTTKIMTLTDISLVPLAAPLIAGPGMIAAAITLSAEAGIISAILSLTLAIFINFLLMLFAEPINRSLAKTHLLGPLIRMTGLVIAAVAMQMMLNGLRSWFRIVLF